MTFLNFEVLLRFNLGENVRTLAELWKEITLRNFSWVPFHFVFIYEEVQYIYSKSSGSCTSLSTCCMYLLLHSFSVLGSIFRMSIPSRLLFLLLMPRTKTRSVLRCFCIRIYQGMFPRNPNAILKVAFKAFTDDCRKWAHHKLEKKKRLVYLQQFHESHSNSLSWIIVSNKVVKIIMEK